MRAVAGASLCLSAVAGAQMIDPPPVTFPRLPSHAPSAEAFVPDDWKIVEKESGDLNGDGKADLALLLKMTANANIVAIDQSEPDKPFDTNPYMLAVALADPAGGYRLAASNHTFFLREEIPYTGNVPPDEGDSVRIERGTLLLYNEYLRGFDSYRFRWNKTEFVLIGYESGGVSGGCAERISINYLTGKVNWSDTPISEDKDVTVSRRVKSTVLPTLSNIDVATFIPSDTIAGEPPSCHA